MSQTNYIRGALYENETSSLSYFLSVDTGKKPSFAKGAPLEFQFAVFSRRQTATDDPALSDLTSMSGLPKMRIWGAQTPTGSVLLDESVASEVVKNDALSVSQWNDRSAQHFKFSFPNTATGLTAGTYYCVIYDSTGKVYGFTLITVNDAGTGASASPTPTPAGYYNTTEIDGKLLDFMPKNLSEGQSISFLARNATTNALFRITDAPIADEQGARIVRTVELVQE